MSSTGTIKRPAAVLKRSAMKAAKVLKATKAMKTGLPCRRQRAVSSGDAFRRLAIVCVGSAWVERRVYAQMQAEGWSLSRQQVRDYIRDHKSADCGDTLRELCLQYGWNRDRIFVQVRAQGLSITRRHVGDEVRHHKAELARVQKLGPAVDWRADLMYDRSQSLGLSLTRAEVRDVARRASPHHGQPLTQKQSRLRRQCRAALLAPMADLAQGRHWNVKSIHAHISGLGQHVTRREVAGLLHTGKVDNTVLGRLCDDCSWDRRRVLSASQARGLGLIQAVIDEFIFRHNEIKRRITSIVQSRASGRNIVHTEAAHRYAPVRQRCVAQFLSGRKSRRYFLSER